MFGTCNRSNSCRYIPHYGSMNMLNNRIIIITDIRPVLVVNVFLVARPHAILEAACFGHYCHYLTLRMLSSNTKINVTILSVVCPGNVQIVQDMLR